SISYYSLRRHLHSFPYTTLFRSTFATAFVISFHETWSASDTVRRIAAVSSSSETSRSSRLDRGSSVGCRTTTVVSAPDGQRKPLDRKSTRLNSSHVKISYAVFCL